jgi:hypothetical protein
LTTQIVRWSPLTSAGRLKPVLRVDTVQGGCSDIGYSLVGGIGYRCEWQHFISSTCFRDGPNPTDYVICAASPWDDHVVRVRSPYLLLYPGVTFAPTSGAPWALELQDGNRCTAILTGSGPIPTPAGPKRADYQCERGGVELADLRRSRSVWTVSAVSWNARSNYGKPSYANVRGAYFGTLPPPMLRQNTLADAAYRAAVRFVRRRSPKAHLDLAWVRLALPAGAWAYVIFTPADATRRGYFELLHRVGWRWIDASGRKPYCGWLPRGVREELFLPARTPGFSPADFSAPIGETRC